MALRYSTSAFLGTTSRGTSVPFMFDTHTQIFNNKPPGILITGQPGSGKTFLALTLACISGVLGKNTIIIDPKGDFINLINLQDQIGEITFWNLGAGGRQNKGVLDPFYLAKDPGETVSLVIGVIEMLVGGLGQEQTTALAPIVKDVMREPSPSLQKVTEMLRMSRTNIAARELGTQLDLIQSLPHASLCFAPGDKNRRSISLTEGMIIITMQGLELPKNEDGSVSNKSMGNKGRFAQTVFFLVTDYIKRVLHDATTTPKTLIIDEAWAVLTTEAGAECVKQVALLGRSKNLALVMVTQNNSHLQRLDIENTIATRFAFNTAQKEAGMICKSMDLDPSYEEVFTHLDPGECIVRDWREHVASVQITNHKKEWAVAFETNPLDKMRAEQNRKKQAQSQPQPN